MKYLSPELRTAPLMVHLGQLPQQVKDNKFQKDTLLKKTHRLTSDKTSRKSFM